MKSTRKFTIVALALLALTMSAYAQSARDQLQQMVEELQRTQTDNALRERIIKLAQSIKPAPALPEEALRYEGRARAAFKSARQESDYLEAAREYQAASLLAPWVAGYYTDLCTMYEEATIYAEARRSCQWALMAERDASAGIEIKRRIAGLELLSERFSKESLSARLDQPLRTDTPGLPAGNRWFCWAVYGLNSGKYPATATYPVEGRQEVWFVSDGTTAHTVEVMWVEAESLAAFGVKLGATFANQNTANLNRYDPPLKVTNPFVFVDSPLKRVQAAQRKYNADTLFTGGTDYEVSEDESVIRRTDWRDNMTRKIQSECVRK